jgi:hypothetical protein
VQILRWQGLKSLRENHFLPIGSSRDGLRVALGVVPKALTYLGCFSSQFPQNCHPERSASQIYRVTQRLWRGVEEPVPSVAEGTPAVLILPMQFRPFRPPKPENRICCVTHLMVRVHVFMHCHPQVEQDASKVFRSVGVFSACRSSRIRTGLWRTKSTLRVNQE